jgi:hypothetical protein
MRCDARIIQWRVQGSTPARVMPPVTLLRNLLAFRERISTKPTCAAIGLADRHTGLTDDTLCLSLVCAVCPGTLGACARTLSLGHDVWCSLALDYSLPLD